MKKKVLIVINNMNIGGVQKSLVNLLQNIQYIYDVSLYCVLSEGSLINEVPTSIKILPSLKSYIPTELSLDEAKKRGLYYYIIKLIGTSWTRLFSKSLPAKILSILSPKIPGEFDVAISYTQPVGSKIFYNLCNEIVLYACRAQKKYTFVHCDYLNYGGNDSYNCKLYHQFNGIIAVSDSVGRAFVQAIPDLKERVFTVYNCCDREKIITKSLIDPLVYDESVSIVTVARLGREKGISRCVCMINSLVKNGYDVKWHIVGDGEERRLIESLIVEYNLQNRIILHGETDNPYRYIKNATFMFLPSFHEAAPMVFGEAAVLGVPILTTNTISAVELVENNGYGWVCDNDDKSIENSLFTVCSYFVDGGKLNIIENNANDKALNSLQRIIG